MRSSIFGCPDCAPATVAAVSTNVPDGQSGPVVRVAWIAPRSRVGDWSGGPRLEAERGAEGAGVAAFLLVRAGLEDDPLMAGDDDPADVEQHGPLPRDRDVEDQADVLERLERAVGVVVDDQ